uniref:Uncharacterized protein n=1 Tax=Triticum urartu TaxID=4572 RepID=A0A8R7K387_TRIUA
MRITHPACLRRPMEGDRGPGNHGEPSGYHYTGEVASRSSSSPRTPSSSSPVMRPSTSTIPMAKAASKPARTHSTNTSRPSTTCAPSSTFLRTSATTVSWSSPSSTSPAPPEEATATTRQHRLGKDPSTRNSLAAGEWAGARRSTRTPAPAPRMEERRAEKSGLAPPAAPPSPRKPSQRWCRLGRRLRTVSTGSPAAPSSARSPAAAPPPQAPPRPYVSRRKASAPVRWS